MVRNDDGQPWFIHGVAFDISELKRTEEALERANVNTPSGSSFSPGV
jgi:hypothetical protein